MARKLKNTEQGTAVGEEHGKNMATTVLDTMMANINKQYGEGTVLMLGGGDIVNTPRFPSGSIALDEALGGGFPVGKIIEIYGPEASGKTTLALHAVASAQNHDKDRYVMYIDVEHALDPVYAANIGVDIANLAFSQPGSGEQALNIAEAAVLSNAVSLIIIDSVAALVPQAELDGEMGDSHVGLQARLMSQGLRKLVSIAEKNKVTIIFINQLREKIGIMFGNPETTTGGRALKYYASIRLDIRRVETLKSGVEMIGNRSRVKVVKNKTAPPFKEAQFDILFGKGISVEGDILDVALNKEIVDKSGSWFSYKGEKIGQGREKAKQYLAENPDVMEEISNAIRSAIERDTTDAAADTTAEDEKTSDALFGN